MLKLIRRTFESKRVRFLFVGGLNTIVGYGAYALLLYSGAHYLVAQLVSTVIGITHSYLWNKYFTFKSRTRSVSEPVRFVAVYGVSYVLNAGILFLTIDLFSMDPYLAGVVGLVVTTVISYIGHSRFSFRKPEPE